MRILLEALKMKWKDLTDMRKWLALAIGVIAVGSALLALAFTGNLAAIPGLITALRRVETLMQPRTTKPP
jgi:hypothetical protein